MHLITATRRDPTIDFSLYSTMLFPNGSRIPYECMILVEPGIVDRQTFAANEHDRKRLAALVKVVLSRRDEWDSREAASAWFLKRAPWKNWDPRVVRLYVVGLMDSLIPPYRDN